MSVKFLYWHWTYFANNLGIYINWRVSVLGDSPIGKLHFLEYFIRIFLKMHIPQPSTDTLQLTYIPQLLSEYIQ